MDGSWVVDRLAQSAENVQPSIVEWHRRFEALSAAPLDMFSGIRRHNGNRRTFERSDDADGRGGRAYTVECNKLFVSLSGLRIVSAISNLGSGPRHDTRCQTARWLGMAQEASEIEI